MSVHLPSSQEDDNTTDLPDSPGRRLHAARQGRGLKIDRVAAALHLSVAMIESLEQDDYDSLPGEVFIVGYIRKYARVVEIDPEPLISAYRRAMPKGTRTWLRPRATPRSGQQVGSGHLVIRLVNIGVLILLAALAFIWWQGRQSGVEVDTDIGGKEQGPVPGEMLDADVDAVEEQTGSNADVKAVPAAPLPDAAQTSLEEPADTASRPQVSPEEQQPTPSAEEEAPVPESITADPPEAPENTAASADDTTSPTDADAEATEILMTFDGPCWVDVRDSERKFKLFGEMKKGDRHVLDGTPPYSVILGNAAAVTITVGGKPLDLDAISQGNVARFTLDPDETP